MECRKWRVFVKSAISTYFWHQIQTDCYETDADGSEENGDVWLWEDVFLPSSNSGVVFDWFVSSFYRAEKHKKVVEQFASCSCHLNFSSAHPCSLFGLWK